MNKVYKNFKRIGLLFGLFLSFSAITSAQTDLNSAIKLTVSERYEDANEAFKELLKAQPNNGDVYFFYGENILKSFLADEYSSTLVVATSQAKKLFDQGLAVDSMNKINAIGQGMIVLMLKNDTLAADKYFVKAEQSLPKKIKKYLPHDYLMLIKLATAELYAKTPRYKKAIAYLEPANVIAPLNVDIVNAMGDIYLHKGEASNAIAKYNRAKFLDPKNPVYPFQKGNLYLAGRNYSAAKEELEEARRIDSTFAPLYKELGYLWYKGGQYKVSKENYRKFLELSGNNIPAKVSYVNSLFYAKDFVEALNIIEEILAVDKSRNYLYRVAAYSSFEKKPADYEKSIAYSETFFKNTMPDDIILKDYLYYGNALLKLHKDTVQIDKGLNMLIKAYEMDTTDYELLSNIALYASGYRRYAIASEIIAKKIAIGKASSADYMTLGTIYYKTKQYDKADSTFTNLIKIDSTNVQAYLWKANTVASQDPESKLGLAKPYYEKVVQKASVDSVKYNKELFDAYGYLGSYYLITKPDFDEAAGIYKKMLLLDPKNKQWLNKGYSSLAVIYTRKKDYKQALEYYNQVLLLDPTNKEIINTIDAIKKNLAAPKR